MTTCALCGSRAGDRLCGFDVCGSCRVGHLHGPVANLGFEVTSRRWTKSSDKSTIHYLEVTVRHPTPFPLEVRFWKQDNAPRLLRWLFPSTDPEVGDELFDDAVHVEAPDSAALRDLLGDEGVQSAVMELVALGSARVSPGCVVATRGSGIVYPDEPELMLPAVLLALHLETRAQVQG